MYVLFNETHFISVLGTSAWLCGRLSPFKRSRYRRTSRYSFFFPPPPALLKLSEFLLFCIIWLQAEITASRVTHSKALNPHTVALHLRMIRAAKTGTRGCSLSRWKQAHGKQILVSGAFDPSHSAHPQQGTSSGFQSRHRPTCFQACTSHLNTLSAEWLLMSRTHPKINKILGWGSFIHLGRDEDYLFFLSHPLSHNFFLCNIYVVDLTSKERIIKPISWLHPELTQGDAEHHSWELDALEMPRINCTTEKGNLPPNKVPSQNIYTTPKRHISKLSLEIKVTTA